MKNSKLSLLFLLCLGAAGTASATKRAPKNNLDIMKAGLQEALAEVKTPEEKEALIGMHDAAVRSIQESTTLADQGAVDVIYRATAYDQLANKLYLGALSPSAKQAAVLSAQQNIDGHRDIKLVALAPVDTQLYDTVIRQMALVGPATKPYLAVVNDSAPTKISLITNLLTGASPMQSPFINDVNGAVTERIVNVAGTQTTKPLIFAAVGATGQEWRAATNDTFNGIAIVTADANGSLKQTNADNVSLFDTPAAVVIKFAQQADNAVNDRMLAFGGTNLTNAQFSTDLAATNTVSMHWSEHLKRLYVGLTQIQPNTGATNGGILSLLVAGVEADGVTPFIKPIVELPTAAMFTSSDQDIIGSAVDSDTNVVTTIHVKTMHTSTGRDYVIVNGGTATDVADVANLNSWVYALPVMPADNANAGQLAVTDGPNAFTLVNGAGQIISVDQGHTSPAYNPDGALFTDAEMPAVVGADPRFLADNTDVAIQNMHVVGDSVYVSVAGYTTTTSGIFQSTALFDQDGLIVKWTPWQRVAGIQIESMRPQGFGINTNNASFMFLGQDDTGNYNQISMNGWGTVEDAFPSNNPSILSDLPANFDGKGGIYKLINYDEKTPGFDPGFSMLIAVGGDTAVIVQTTNEDSVKQPLFKFNNAALSAIAPLTSAAFVDQESNDKKVPSRGYLLFGGLGGIVRLDQDTDGTGIDTSAGISDIGTIGNSPVFKKIGTYTNVTDLQKIARTENLIVATYNKAFVIQAADAANPEVIATDDDTSTIPLVLTKPFVHDVQNSENIMLASTTQGIFGMNIIDGSTITLPKIKGSPVQMKFLHDQKGGGNDGNLYVLAVDRDNNTGLVYRFYVEDNVVSPIDLEADGVTPKAIKDLKQFAHLFTTDGNATLITRSQEVNSTEMLNVFVNTNNKSDVLHVIDDELNVSTDNATKLFMGTPNRTVHGNWIIPGSFGVRVNE